MVGLAVLWALFGLIVWAVLCVVVKMIFKLSMAKTILFGLLSAILMPLAVIGLLMAMS